MEASQLADVIRQAQAKLDAWLDAHPAHWRTLASQMAELPLTSGKGLIALLCQPGVERRYRRQWRRAVSRLDATLRTQAPEIGMLLMRCRTLQRQNRMLATIRRIMSLWHTMHVPLGLVLFTLALLHVIAALFYS